MRKILIICGIVLSTISTIAQTEITLLLEDFGNVSSHTAVENHTGFSKEGVGATNVTYWGTNGVTVRSTLPSSGYSGASGNGNVFFTGAGTPNGGDIFLISNINPTGATSMRISFGTQATTPTLSVEYSTNGTTWTNIPYTKTSTDWELVTANFNIPSGSTNLHLRFTSESGMPNNGFRIDDVKLTNTFIAVTNITGVPTTATAGTPLTLTGTVVPSNATNKTIQWSVTNAGTTGASISGNKLSTTAGGTVTIRATITNGASTTTNYTKDFTITVQGGVQNNFKFTTFNAEWLGCATEGPERNLQINNVATLISTIKPDVIALQEVHTSSSYATIDTLVKRLGGSDWGGAIVPTVPPYSDCGQWQAIIYKKSRVQSVSETELTTSTTYEGNSFYYSWSNGRTPIAYEVNLITENGNIPVTFVNIHAKAMPDEASYSRRRSGSVLLKGILDGTNYNTKNVVILGDFNDYLDGTMCSTCGEISPYQNFTSDATNYWGLTGHIQAVNYNNPTISNIIISNELFDSYVLNSAVMEISASNAIPNFDNTTSKNHRPISATFNIATSIDFVAVTGITGVPTTANAGTPLALTGTVAPSNATNKTIVWSVTNAGTTGASINGNTLNTTADGTVIVRATIVNGETATTNYTQDFTIAVNSTATNIAEIEADNSILVYPNPVKDELWIVNYEWKNGDMIELFDMNGKRVYSARAHENTTIDMSAFQQGNYILRIGNRVAKIVKQ